MFLDSRTANQSEWWGPQRPGKLVNISSVREAMDADAWLTPYPLPLGGFFVCVHLSLFRSLSLARSLSLSLSLSITS